MPVFSPAGLLLVLASVVTLQAQSTQTGPAVDPSFEVASIRPAISNSKDVTNLDLDASDYFRYTGGPVTASGSVINYIIFAYKIQDRSQADLIYSHLPAWKGQQYTLRATIQSKQTKDQLRLMVRSLLADRFQLKLHTETRQLPVYSLVVDHTPALGLIPQTDDALCTKPFDQPKPPPHPSTLPRSCQLIVSNKGDLRRVRMGDFTPYSDR